MVECPVCGEGSPRGQAACGACGLPTELFDAVRDIADPAGDPKFAHAVAELLGATEAVRPGASRRRPVEPPAVPAANPSRGDLFAPGGESPRTETGRDVRDLPDSSAEVFRIGRSLELDVSALERAFDHAGTEGSPVQLARLRRDLVRLVLDGLLDRYRRLCDRRDALSSLVQTGTLDAELAAYRRALAEGNLTRAEEQRQKAQQAVESIDASWSRIETQFMEAGQMMRALRELGGVAPGVLRPVAEAIQNPRGSEAGQIERRLARANRLLWGLLVPRMDYLILQGRSRLSEGVEPAARLDPIRSEIDRMAEKIRDQKIGEALESHRFLRAELASLTPRPSRRSVRRSFIE